MLLTILNIHSALVQTKIYTTNNQREKSEEVALRSEAILAHNKRPHKHSKCLSKPLHKHQQALSINHSLACVHVLPLRYVQ